VAEKDKEFPEVNLEGAVRREQSVTADWSVLRDTIDGVRLKEMRSVIKQNGYLTEIYRTDWNLDQNGVDQVFQVLLNPGATEAWHVHSHTTDRFFASSGRILLVLYDARENSPTYGLVNEFRAGAERPALLVVPPGVWHGVSNIGTTPVTLVNLVDVAYNYESPDHWGLPADTNLIPYRFES
jgi:dTDP-4-dehydrorhamnose 3,5-epimerase